MKRRPTAPPPVVVTKKRASPAAPPAVRRPTDTKIRTWHADDPQPEPRPPPSKAYAQLLDAEINVHVARLRLANDPDVVRGAAEKLARRDEAENAMASILALPNHPLGPGYLVVAKKGSFNILGLALKALFSLVNFVKPSKAVDVSPSSLRPFIKAMRKGE
jgi:hypothetical protein